MYEIIKECEENILNGFSARRPGRKPKGAPSTLDEALKRISVLEDEKIHEAREKERLYARSEFLKIRLKQTKPVIFLPNQELLKPIFQVCMPVVMFKIRFIVRP